MTDTVVAQNPLAGVLSVDQVDVLVNAAEDPWRRPTRGRGVLSRMNRAVLERAVETETSDHLGYESGDRDGAGTDNSRNGKTTKSVQTLQGPVQITGPRDRNGLFEPVIVPKWTRRLGRVEDMILPLYARGMTIGDIGSHREEIYGSKVSAATISRVTDEVAQWQSRSLETVYPVGYIDAIWLKICDGGVVTDKACLVAVGMDLEGRK